MLVEEVGHELELQNLRLLVIFLLALVVEDPELHVLQFYLDALDIAPKRLLHEVEAPLLLIVLFDGVRLALATGFAGTR